MEKTWRWFGKKDKITLDMLRQIGVEGIVTALHDVPNGEIWTEEAINDLKTYIESYGLRWSVVESLPVCEAIKYAGPEREQLIENYKISLANLGKCGVKTVCYNFMPVIDWIRTDLQHPWADGTSSLYFDRVRFAYFDLRILQREGAEKDYSAEELAKVAELDKTITKPKRQPCRCDYRKDAGIRKRQHQGRRQEPGEYIQESACLVQRYRPRCAPREHAVFPCRHHAGVRGVRRKYVRTSRRPTFPGTGLAAYRDQRRGHRLVPECSG